MKTCIQRDSREDDAFTHTYQPNPSTTFLYTACHLLPAFFCVFPFPHAIYPLLPASPTPAIQHVLPSPPPHQLFPFCYSPQQLPACNLPLLSLLFVALPFFPIPTWRFGVYLLPHTSMTFTTTATFRDRTDGGRSLPYYGHLPSFSTVHIAFHFAFLPLYHLPPRHCTITYLHTLHFTTCLLYCLYLTAVQCHCHCYCYLLPQGGRKHTCRRLSCPPHLREQRQFILGRLSSF